MRIYLNENEIKALSNWSNCPLSLRVKLGISKAKFELVKELCDDITETLNNIRQDKELIDNKKLSDTLDIPKYLREIQEKVTNLLKTYGGK